MILYFEIIVLAEQLLHAKGLLPGRIVIVVHQRAGNRTGKAGRQRHKSVMMCFQQFPVYARL